MRRTTLLARHPVVRWLMPVGVLGVVALVAGVLAAQASPGPLPPTTSVRLLADVESSSVDGFSATMVTRLSLGLPELPGLATGQESLSVASLLSGSHTVRVWYGGPDRQRLALLGPMSESDVFRSGSDLWEWDSDTRVATHTVLPSSPAHPAPTGSATASPSASLTPDQLAAQLLARLDPTTAVSLGQDRTVADRAAYDLVLTPRTSATTVGSVHIAIDGETKLPLAVEVYPRSGHVAAVDLAYSAISFSVPPARTFTFTPPSGATVRTNTGRTGSGQSKPSSEPVTSWRRVDSTGTGWTTVVQYRADPAQLTKVAGGSLGRLPTVHGAWGTGHLLSGALFSVLMTDDGRVFAGAVDADALFAAAAAH